MITDQDVARLTNASQALLDETQRHGLNKIILKIRLRELLSEVLHYSGAQVDSEQILESLVPWVEPFTINQQILIDILTNLLLEGALNMDEWRKIQTMLDMLLIV